MTASGGAYGGKARLFVALDPSDDVREALRLRTPAPPPPLRFEGAAFTLGGLVALAPPPT